MKEINKVKVSYNGKVVGTIIRYQRYLTAFAYDPEWLSNGFSISPFSLPLREEPFDGLFGVFAHNRDDHSKNFSFIYSDDEKKWLLLPAYDLTYSYSIGGEHATTVDGNGKNPGMKDILEVANKLGMNLKLAEDIAQQVQACVEDDLGEILSKRF